MGTGGKNNNDEIKTNGDIMKMISLRYAPGAKGSYNLSGYHRITSRVLMGFLNKQGLNGNKQGLNGFSIISPIEFVIDFTTCNTFTALSDQADWYLE